MPNQDLLTAQGAVSTQPRPDLPAGNWVSIAAFTANPVNVPHSQTGAASTVVAAVVLVPQTSGLFKCSVRASFSDGTTAGLVTTSLFTKQGAGAGALAGGVAAAKLGAYAASNPASAGQVLNVDAAGGGGITFEGATPATITQHSDASPSLTGLLTAQGLGAMNFECGMMMLDALGTTSLVKTPFAIGKPMCVALAVSSTAAHVISYDSLAIFVEEILVG